jgi:hypothetical protein
MSQDLLIICDYLPQDFPWELPTRYNPTARRLPDGIPELADLKRYGTVLVIGQLADEGSAIQFGGALRLAVESGLSVIFMYPVRLAACDRRLIEQLLPEIEGMSTYGAEWSVVTDHESFHEYFAVYGRAGSVIRPPSGDAEIIGRVENDPCALSVLRGSGQVYIVPFHVADVGSSLSAGVSALLAAVAADTQGSAFEPLPDFLSELRLPGETQLLDEIQTMEAETEVKRDTAQKLQAYRNLIGTATGPGLEALTIDALNVILDGTDVAAEDREDVGIEDFWLVTPQKDVALAEVKGIGAHVRRANINQVDDHRDAHELKPDAMPGLLIVNVFRNSTDEDAAQRELPVNEDVVLHAVRNNVLILRTRDLFYLLHRKLAGEDAATELLNALGSGGGWLKVNDGKAELQTF